MLSLAPTDQAHSRPHSSAARLDDVEIRRVVAGALAEDVGSGDVTTDAIVPEGRRGTARIVLNDAGVVCGMDIVGAVFAALDPQAVLRTFAGDGAVCNAAPATVAEVEATVRALLTGERTALNLLGRLSGIATMTQAYVEAVAGTGCVILDTRKTTPGLRALEKYAVVTGGGVNHRFGLHDAVLIKDNHLLAARSLGDAVALVRSATGLPVKVECDTLAQVEEAMAAGADALLLDNMAPATIRAAVAIVAGRARLEASGGVTLATIREIAEAGVDEISVGALTHSARSLDVSLEVD
jgi:nicotinate-nucleotide pyrophosphorylase (carboxylating)